MFPAFAIAAALLALLLAACDEGHPSDRRGEDRAFGDPEIGGSDETLRADQ